MLEGFDIGHEMSVNPEAQRLMFSLIDNGGRISILGIPEEPLRNYL